MTIIGHSEGRLEAVDALRGIAVLAVTILHCFAANNEFLPDGPTKAMLEYGRLGVEVFFVVSGFIIPYSMWRAGFVLRRDWLSFVCKRESRLAPPYLVSILVVMVITVVASWVPGFRGDPPSYSVPQVLSHVGYVTALFDYAWVSPVYWTLALEFQFYVLIMLCFPLLIRDSRVGTGIAVTLLIVTLVPTSSSSRIIAPYMGLFVMGIVVFQIRSGVVRTRRAHVMLLLCTIATIRSLGLAEAIAGLLTAIVIQWYRRPAPRVLLWLGTISYSVYLIHMPIGPRICNLGERLARGVGLDAVIIVAAVGASILAGLGFYYLIERPSLEWAKRIRYPMKQNDRFPPVVVKGGNSASRLSKRSTEGGET